MSVMQQDLYFRYFAYNCPSVCHVRVLQGQEESVAILSELRENPGPSVTNTVGWLIPLLRAHLEQEGILECGDRVTWVEHVDCDVVYRKGHLARHSYTEVWLGEAGSPNWCYLSDTLDFLAERFNYPGECFDIGEARLLVGLAAVVDLPIARAQ